MINNGLSNDELFKLMDRLSINEIGALLAGASPSDVFIQYNNDNEPYYCLSKFNYSNRPSNADDVFDMMLKILCRAIIAGELKAQIVANTYNQSLYLDDLTKDWLALGEIDTAKTTITRNDIKDWLDNRGVYPIVFFPNGRKDDYMNPAHEYYSPDLALCVRAWEVAQTADYDNTTKQFMAEWIKENASTYKWVNHQKPQEPMGEKKAQELASVANWNTKGGAVKGNPKLKEPTPPPPQYEPVYNDLKINLTQNWQNNYPKSDDNTPFGVPTPPH